jgi:peptidoglycan-associated lipoprotein
MTPKSRTLLSALAALAILAAGCAKKAPAPPPAPPAPSTTPTPSQPPPTPPSTPAPTPTPPAPGLEATLAELRTVYFALDSYTLDDGARSALDANGKLLRERADVKVRIEGHCDERGTVEYNLSLGEKRAGAVRDYLVNAGVEANRLTTISYGKERPVVEGHDEAAWSRNRRAEFSKP